MLLVQLNTFNVKRQKKVKNALDRNLLKLGLTKQVAAEEEVKKDS